MRPGRQEKNFRMDRSHRMKLRIKGDSLRLRVSRSELGRVLEGTAVVETIHFGTDPDQSLTYALVCGTHADSVNVLYRDRIVTVSISGEQMRGWSHEDQVGVYARIDLGTAGALDVAIEKDFACLDRNDEENADTFANPHAGQSC
jgi:hypothetical protein